VPSGNSRAAITGPALNVFARLYDVSFSAIASTLDGKPAILPVVTAPQALTLAHEPIADTARYDALRQDEEARHAS
jgi:hypothetical protein